jgi:mannose-1-phosphate guanylyltransferase
MPNNKREAGRIPPDWVLPVDPLMKGMDSLDVVIVIMAGGRGERFWPKSTASTPKQFLSLIGEETLLQQTFNRAVLATHAPENVYVITGTAYRELVLSQLPELPIENLIIEPEGRDTAPAIGYAAVTIRAQRHDAIMVVLPSDHVILDEDKFLNTLEYSVELASRGDYLITLGIKPTRPEVGYGYIEFSQPLNEDSKAYRVKSFKEKPDADTALKFLKDGRYLWNAGIFVWKISSILQAFQRYAPGMYHSLCTIENHLKYEKSDEVSSVFMTLERKSIDYSILEKADNILVVTGDFGWDDMGTWVALERICAKDDHGNIIKGETITIDATGNIIDNSIGDKLFVAFGVTDLVMVNSDDVILVAEKKASADLKRVVEEVRRRKKFS